MKRSTWILLEDVLGRALEMRRELEAGTIVLEGETDKIPAEGELAAEWLGILPPVSSVELAKAMEDLRDGEAFD